MSSSNQQGAISVPVPPFLRSSPALSRVRPQAQTDQQLATTSKQRQRRQQQLRQVVHQPSASSVTSNKNSKIREPEDEASRHVISIYSKISIFVELHRFLSLEYYRGFSVVHKYW